MRKVLEIAQTRTNAKRFVPLRSAPALLRNSIANTRARRYNAAQANNSGERTSLACASPPLAETPHDRFAHWMCLLRADIAASKDSTALISRVSRRLPGSPAIGATQNQIVSHAHVHNSGSSSHFARSAIRSASTFGRRAANTVAPEPDISAAATSGWFNNHI